MGRYTFIYKKAEYFDDSTLRKVEIIVNEEKKGVQ